MRDLAARTAMATIATIGIDALIVPALAAIAALGGANDRRLTGGRAIDGVGAAAAAARIPWTTISGVISAQSEPSVPGPPFPPAKLLRNCCAYNTLGDTLLKSSAVNGRTSPRLTIDEPPLFKPPQFIFS